MRIIKTFYFWMMLAIIAGISFGALQPQIAAQLEPLGLNFIKLIKVFIGPIVFFTVTLGIAQSSDIKKLGTIGLKAFIYFEIISTLALLLGWLTAVVIKPGSLLQVDSSQLDSKTITQFVKHADELTASQFIQNIIPSNIIEPFLHNDLLQILFLAVLTGCAILLLPQAQNKKILPFMETIIQLFFRIIRLVIYVAPLGVFGAMAFTTSKLGVDFIFPLLGLIGTFYLTGLLFIVVVLGTVAKFSGFSLFKFIQYIMSELLLVLGTSSSESALPQLLNKLENLGCRKETVGVVVPLGYSFNLDGTNIYITLAALFIAQAMGIQLTFSQELLLFLTAMLTSKGAAGVTGAGFITLAATLAVVPIIPAVGLVIILGVDRFMSEARALVNFIGNGVAALVISRWQGEITSATLQQQLNNRLCLRIG